MLDIPAESREQLLRTLSGLIEQSTALADALGLDDTAAGLRSARMQVGGATKVPIAPQA